MGVLLFLCAFLSISQTWARLYTIYNNCPQKINYYLNGTKQGTLGVRINTKLNLPDDWSGVIYSDINGGSQSGAKTTRAGFNARGGYYYIIVESRLNTGITIEPQASSDNGFCVRDMCDNKACTSIYHSPPTSFPPPSTSPPEPPLYSCPKRGVDYKVTFCPSGGFAPPRNSEPIPIHPRGDLSKCLDVRAGNVVQINTCDGRESQKWLVSAGLTLINLFGTPFCLDAGKQLGDGSALTVQQCTYNPPDSQSWDYTEDKRFQLYLTGQCLDLVNGTMANGSNIRTSDCLDKDSRQIWSFP